MSYELYRLQRLRPLHQCADHQEQHPAEQSGLCIHGSARPKFHHAFLLCFTIHLELENPGHAYPEDPPEQADGGTSSSKRACSTNPSATISSTNTGKARGIVIAGPLGCGKSTVHNWMVDDLGGYSNSSELLIMQESVGETPKRLSYLATLGRARSEEQAIKMLTSVKTIIYLKDFKI